MLLRNSVSRRIALSTERRGLRALVGALLATASLSMAAPLRADEPIDVGMAQSLFDAGRALMEQGKPQEACPKFEESNRVDPSAGTLLNLGKCFDALGRTASAWASYKKAITVGKSTGQARQVAAAEEFITEIEPRLSKLTVVVSSNTPGLTVRRIDSRPGSAPLEITEAARGLPLAVDPGEYRIEATAKGYVPWSLSVKVASSEPQTVTVPDLNREPPPVIVPPKPPSKGMSTLRIAGIASGAGGVVLLAVGATLGGLTLSEASKAENDPTLCPQKKCTPKGEQAVDAARAKGVGSTVTLVVGGAALATGAVLFALSVLEDSRSRRAPPKSSSRRIYVLPTYAPTTGGASVPAFGAIIGGTL